MSILKFLAGVGGAGLLVTDLRGAVGALCDVAEGLFSFDKLELGSSETLTTVVAL